ncbi:hypothetical protein B0G81_1383 [Paraburkholderia sp. BL6665CI2N2]|nr:hypothetical protein B0G81_1383 [Paraburkholderia sp. BL6665CI2N2]
MVALVARRRQCLLRSVTSGVSKASTHRQVFSTVVAGAPTYVGRLALLNETGHIRLRRNPDRIGA